MPQKSEIVSQWSESAPYWDKHRKIIHTMFAPVTQALIEDAGIARCRSVLDVATGPGEPALSIAGLIAPDGKVVGVDPVPDMVEAARREAQRRELSNASFEMAFADSLPFRPASFDAVVSRFGAMFFPSPVDSLRELLRVLQPGGKIALAVWHFANDNPFHYALAQVVEKYVPSPPPTPDSPDPFRFADPGKLMGLLSEAGAVATSERLLRFSIGATMAAEDFWTLRGEMSEKFRKKLAQLSKQQIADLTDEVLEALKAYTFGEEIIFPGEVLIVSGAKT
jgi:ubiquinone/menaquinone biosynthesis C-methylase UbiE